MRLAEITEGRKDFMETPWRRRDRCVFRIARPAGKCFSFLKYVPDIFTDSAWANFLVVVIGDFVGVRRTRVPESGNASW